MKNVLLSGAILVIVLVTSFYLYSSFESKSTQDITFEQYFKREVAMKCTTRIGSEEEGAETIRVEYIDGSDSDYIRESRRREISLGDEKVIEYRIVDGLTVTMWQEGDEPFTATVPVDDYMSHKEMYKAFSTENPAFLTDSENRFIKNTTCIPWKVDGSVFEVPTTI